jgi:ketosteroid isomerase-like protein
MHRHVIAIAAAAILLLAGGCARRPFDAKAEEANLLKRDAEWAAAAAGKDVEKIISYWSDDALVMPPGQPSLEGKAALRSYVTDSLKIPGFQIRWKSDKVSFSPDGKLAYMRGTNETTVTGSDGAPATLHGRAVTVWRKDADGQWRCVVDIWNAPPPLPQKDNRERPR